MEVTKKIILDKKTKQQLLKMKVKRTELGLSIYLQSEILETFFKKYGICDDGEWCGLKCYNTPMLNSHFRNLLTNWYGDLTYNRNYPNLAFLRAVGLFKGVQFILEGNVYTKNEILTFIKQFREQTIELFNEYIKPMTMEIELITEIRGDEIEI